MVRRVLLGELPMTPVSRAVLFCAALLTIAAPCPADPAVTAKFVAAAIALENPNVVYDSSYRRIAYPLGDVPQDVGVCADVIVRAYRKIGVDLQKLVHEDMARRFSAYPKTWRMTRADANIDHRRVPNLAMFFKRHGKTLKVTGDAKDYAAGDIVTWNLRERGFLPHIGIVTDRLTPGGTRPLVMHNIGGGQVLEDVLFRYKIVGHFRYGLD
jgi:uncharacterized protein